MNISIKKYSKFLISQNEYLQISPTLIPSEDCTSCFQIDIDYIDEINDVCVRVGYKTIQSFCYFIVESGFFEKLLQGQNILDKAILGDPGIEWNNYFKGLRGPTDIDQFLFCSNDHKLIRPYYNAWLYNDKNGDIIFEITPFYPYLYETKQTHLNFVSYKQFMRDYKTTVITRIPKYRLNQWVQQAILLQQCLGLNY